MKAVTLGSLEIGRGIPKIIIPITGESRDGIIAQGMKLRALGADAAEWRADWFHGLHSRQALMDGLKGLREAILDMPLIFTCRTAPEGGKADISPEEYLEVNMAMAHSGLVDGVDIELMSYPAQGQIMLEELHRAGLVAIGSRHISGPMPPQEKMAAMLLDMCSMGADIQKLAVYARSPREGCRLLMAAKAAGQAGAGPLIPIAMGENGLVSRVAGELFYGAAVFAAIDGGSAPGQLSPRATRAALTAVHNAAMEG